MSWAGIRWARNPLVENSAWLLVSMFQYKDCQSSEMPLASHRWHTTSPFQWALANFQSFLCQPQSPLCSVTWNRSWLFVKLCPANAALFPCKGLPLGSVVGCTPYHAWLHDHVMRLKKAGSVLLVIRSSGIANSKNLLHLTERGFQRTMFKNIANMFSLPNLVVTLALSP